MDLGLSFLGARKITDVTIYTAPLVFEVICWILWGCHGKFVYRQITQVIVRASFFFQGQEEPKEKVLTSYSFNNISSFVKEDLNYVNYLLCI